MASAATSLPAPAHQAAKSALNAALAENNIVDKDGAQNGDDGEPGEIQEVDMQAQAENIRTVFNDPKNFNVKVCVHAALYSLAEVTNVLSLQHPLFSPWTLWFDSPATKGRNLPQTPMSSFPQTPLPQTPGGLAAAAQGWMEDIKRVISFDSVEEFWGCVLTVLTSCQARYLLCF